MMRIDGRSHDALRPLRATPGWIKYAEGSVLIEVGDTRVLCTASLEDKVPHWLKGQGHGWVTGEYQMVPRSTEVRTPRESNRGGPGGRTHEIQRLIGRSLRAVTDLDALGERTVWLDCDVLQADGGTRTAAVTGACLALALACERLSQRGVLRKFPLRDLVAATSVGVVSGDALLDLSYAEDSQAAVDMNIVKTGDGRYVEIQGTAEEAPFDRATTSRLLDLADLGIAALVAWQREVLGPLAARIGSPAA